MFVGIVCELICLAGLNLTDAAFSFARLRASQQEVSSGRAVSTGASEAIHPYLGWVMNPQLTGQDDSDPDSFKVPLSVDRSMSVNHLGFRDDGASVYQRSEDQLILGIAGGSVAWGLSWEAEDLIRRRLAEYWPDRTLRIVRLAMPGYKQPQQLMAASFLLALGAEFDFLVNIDGYNEAALSVAENYLNGTAVIYPRAWYARTIVITDPRSSDDAWQLLVLRGQRQKWARTIQRPPWSWSATANLIWYRYDQRMIAAITDLGYQISGVRDDSFLRHGPVEEFENEQQMREEVVSIWQRCSLQLHHLCAANGCRYIHVLQPNQYHVGSKPLSQLELERAWSEEEISSRAIRDLYPAMIRAGAELRDAGVQFSDQTQLFADVVDTIYIDPWCHYNLEGSLRLAEEVVQQVLATRGP